MYHVVMGQRILFRHDDAAKAESLAQHAANAMKVAVGVWFSQPTGQLVRLAMKTPDERSIP